MAWFGYNDAPSCKNLWLDTYFRFHYTGITMNSKLPTSMRNRFLCVCISAITLVSVTACSSINPFSSAKSSKETPKATKSQSSNAVKSITEGQFGYVHLEKIESGASLNDHPYSISDEDLKTVLSKLQVKILGVEEPLFNEEELNDVTPSLSQGLINARTDQDVTFAVVGKHGASRFNTAISGRLFIKNDQLNIIFNEVRGEFEPEFRSLGVVRPFLPGSRNKPSQVTISTSADISYPTSGRRDWVAIAANAIPNTTPVPRSPQKAAPAAAPASVAPAPVSPSTSPTPDYQDIEKRLTVIKDLKQKGLITEQEYDQKRKEILKNL